MITAIEAKRLVQKAEERLVAWKQLEAGIHKVAECGYRSYDYSLSSLTFAQKLKATEIIKNKLEPLGYTVERKTVVGTPCGKIKGSDHVIISW